MRFTPGCCRCSCLTGATIPGCSRKYPKVIHCYIENVTNCELIDGMEIKLNWNEMCAGGGVPYESGLPYFWTGLLRYTDASHASFPYLGLALVTDGNTWWFHTADYDSGIVFAQVNGTPLHGSRTVIADMTCQKANFTFDVPLNDGSDFGLPSVRVINITLVEGTCCDDSTSCAGLCDDLCTSIMLQTNLNPGTLDPPFQLCPYDAYPMMFRDWNTAQPRYFSVYSNLCISDERATLGWSDGQYLLLDHNDFNSHAEGYIFPFNYVCHYQDFDSNPFTGNLDISFTHNFDEPDQCHPFFYEKHLSGGLGPANSTIQIFEPTIFLEPECPLDPDIPYIAQLNINWPIQSLEVPLTFYPEKSLYFGVSNTAIPGLGFPAIFSSYCYLQYTGLPRVGQSRASGWECKACHTAFLFSGSSILPFHTVSRPIYYDCVGGGIASPYVLMFSGGGGGFFPSVGDFVGIYPASS